MLVKLVVAASFLVMATPVAPEAAWAGLVPQLATVTVSADTIIAARQSAYDLQNGIAEAMKDGIAHDASPKSFVNAAKALARYGTVIPSLFPTGTETGGGTKAKPEIWSDRAGFEKAASNFNEAALALQARAEADDKPGFAAAFEAMGKTCGACHRAYRVKTGA